MRKFIGSLPFNSVVGVTDPCYDQDVWCRHSVACKPGVYDCYVYTHDFGEYGTRVTRSVIIHENEDPEILESGSWQEDGNIGVDAGLAGFFDDKPDFDDIEWSEFCDLLNATTDEYIFVNTKVGEKRVTGFFSSSGFGDGYYPVRVIRDGEEAIAIDIIFEEEEEWI